MEQEKTNARTIETIMSDVDENLLRMLEPETIRILEKVEKITGLPIRVKWESNNDLEYDNVGEIIGLVDVSGIDKDFHLVRCNPRFVGHINHTLVHESMHILRRWQAPFNKWKFLALPEQNLWTTIIGTKPQIKDELIELIKRGLLSPSESYNFFCNWVRDVLFTLACIPEDIRIEMSIWNNYGFIRKEQIKSLLVQIMDVSELYDEHYAHKLGCPPTLYSLKLAISSAYIIFACCTLGEITLLKQSKGIKEFDMRRRLLVEGLDKKDRGFIGDCSDIDRWAKMLGIEGWFTWIIGKENIQQILETKKGKESLKR
jgi:hypothetical protein